MGRLYNKSRSDAFQEYFAKSETIESGKAQCWLYKGGKISAPVAKGFSEGGIGGIPLSWNREKKCVYIDHTDSHTLIFGATGSQKTRIGIMPTVMLLGKAGESMIITDPKSEIYDRTAEYLYEFGYNVQVLNLRSTLTGDGWNPFSVPYKFYLDGDIDRAYEFVSDIAHNLTHSAQDTNKDPFWENSAESLLFGLTILMFRYCKDFKITSEYVNVASVMCLREKMFSDGKWIAKKSPYWDYAKRDSFIYSSLVGTVETANDTQGGILSTFDEKMACFKIQPGLLQALCEDSIDFKQLSEPKKAIYIIMPDEKTTFHKLVALFIKQSYEYLIYQVYGENKTDAHSKKLSCRVNYVLDEFSSLPPIRDFPAMITAARSRNIRFFLVVQSKKQIIQRYGEETETIQSNCSNWLFFTSREISLLQELSELCGVTNKRQPIIEPAELQHLNKEDHEVLVFNGRNRPYIAILPDVDEFCPQSHQMSLRKKKERPIHELQYEKCIPQEDLSLSQNHVTLRNMI